MMNTRRPLSPHLQIYKPQLTSVLSILHRITGLVLVLGALVIALWIIAAGFGPDAFASVDRLLDSGLGRMLLFAWSLCLFYHLCNGIRHLVWDAGFGFDIPTVYASGKAVVAAAVVLTALTWVVA